MKYAPCKQTNKQTNKQANKQTILKFDQEASKQVNTKVPVAVQLTQAIIYYMTYGRSLILCMTMSEDKKNDYNSKKINVRGTTANKFLQSSRTLQTKGMIYSQNNEFLLLEINSDTVDAIDFLGETAPLSPSSRSGIVWGCLALQVEDTTRECGRPTLR